MLHSSSLVVEKRGPITRLRMTMKVAGLPLHETSAFVVADTLVDAAAPTSARELISHLRREPVARVILTHHHEDHAGCGADIQREFGIPVYAPQGALDILATGPRLPFYRRVLATSPRPYRALPLAQTTRCGDFTLETVPTPGHTFDHVCFFEPVEGWLFTGDLFVHERVPVLRGIENAQEQIASLKSVMALKPSILCCSQAGFVEDGTAALARKIEYWEGLANRARELRLGGMSPRRIARELLGHEGLFTWVSLGEFSKKRLIESLLDEG